MRLANPSAKVKASIIPRVMVTPAIAVESIPVDMPERITVAGPVSAESAISLVGE